MEFNPLILQDNLEYFRRKKGLTQAQLGDLVGVDQYNIQRYESGATFPKIPTLAKLAIVLDASLDSLFFEIIGPDGPTGKSLQEKFSDDTIPRLKDEIDTQKNYIKLLERRLQECEDIKKEKA